MAAHVTNQLAVRSYHPVNPESRTSIRSGSCKFQLPTFESYMMSEDNVTQDQLTHYLERIDSCFESFKPQADETFSNAVLTDLFSITQRSLRRRTRKILCKQALASIDKCFKLTLLKMDEKDRETFWSAVCANDCNRSVQEFKREPRYKEIIDQRKQRPLDNYALNALYIKNTFSTYFYSVRSNGLPIELDLKVFSYLNPQDIVHLHLAQKYSFEITRSRVLELYRHATEINSIARQNLENAYRILRPEGLELPVVIIPAIQASVSHVTDLQLPTNHDQLSAIAQKLATLPEREFIKNVYFDPGDEVPHLPVTGSVVQILDALPNLETFNVKTDILTDEVLVALSRKTKLKNLTLRDKAKTKEMYFTLPALRINLARLTSLEVVTLKNFGTFSGSIIIELLENCRNLRSIQLVNDQGNRPNQRPLLLFSDPELQRAADLQNLALRFLEVDGYSIVPFDFFKLIQACSNIRSVCFENCRFTSQFTNLHRSESLTSLMISECYIDNTQAPLDIFEILNACPILEHLDVSYPQSNWIRQIVIPDRNYPSLRRLDIKSQHLSKSFLLALLDKFPNIEEVRGSENPRLHNLHGEDRIFSIRREGLERVYQTYPIKKLDLANSNLHINWRVLLSLHRTFPQMETLDLSLNPIEENTFRRPPAIRGQREKATFPGLHELKLSDSTLDDAALSGILTTYPNLKVIDIRGDHIQGHGFYKQRDGVVTELELEKIFIRSCPITQSGLSQICKACPSLKEVHLSSCKDLAEDAFQKLKETYPNVKFVGIDIELRRRSRTVLDLTSIGNHQINDQKLHEYMLQHPKIERIIAPYQGISGEFFNLAASHEARYSLKYLELYNNPITENGLRKILDHCPSLQELKIQVRNNEENRRFRRIVSEKRATEKVIFYS